MFIAGISTHYIAQKYTYQYNAAIKKADLQISKPAFCYFHFSIKFRI